MSAIKHFLSEDDGAVTVDWVVLTAGLVGLGLATMAVVSSGTEDLSRDVGTELTGISISSSFGSAAQTTEWSGLFSSDYLAQGAALAPGNNGATYGWAQTFAAADAPAGYNFGNPLYDPATGNVIYTSDDGLSYSIGGVVTPIADYQGTAAYWGA